jgi:hypothetical protein
LCTLQGWRVGEVGSPADHRGLTGNTCTKPWDVEAITPGFGVENWGSVPFYSTAVSQRLFCARYYIRCWRQVRKIWSMAITAHVDIAMQGGDTESPKNDINEWMFNFNLILPQRADTWGCVTCARRPGKTSWYVHSELAEEWEVTQEAGAGEGPSWRGRKSREMRLEGSQGFPVLSDSGSLKGAQAEGRRMWADSRWQKGLTEEGWQKGS